MRQSIQIREEENLELMVEYMAAAGFHEAAISLGSGELCFKSDFEDRAKYIRELLDKNGLACRQTHLPCYSLLESSEITCEETENAIKNAFKVSAILGAEWAAYHPRTSLTGCYDRNKSFLDNKEKLTEYLEYAEKYGVGIGVENMPLYPDYHPDWKFFGGDWEELINLVDSFDSDKIGICWDFGHGHTASIKQDEAIKRVANRLKITHIHDNYRNNDEHQLPLLGSLECGCIYWKEIIQALREINYSGPMTLELFFPPVPMLKNFVACCKDCLECMDSMAE